MKLIYSIVFSICFTTFLGAQDSLNARGSSYFFLGFSLPLVKVRDEGHSTLTYRGLNPTFRFGYERVGKDAVSRISISFSAGDVKPKTRPQPEKTLSKAEISITEVNYSYYKRLGNAYDTEGVNRYVGGGLSFMFDARSYNLPSNNLFGYQANLSLNAGGYFMKKINSSVRVNDEVLTPLLTFSLRPNYIGLMPTTTGDFSVKKVLKTGRIVTVNKVFRLYNRLGFDHQINDHRQRRLSYTWDGLMNNVSRPLRSVSAGLTYESLFKM